MKTRPPGLLAAVSSAHALDHVYLLAFPTLLAPLMAEFRTGPFGAGSALTWLNLMSGMFALPAGWLADRFGPSRTIAVFLAGAAACLVLAAGAPDLTALSLALLGLGTFCGLYHPAGLSLVSRRCRPVGRAMGIHGIGGSLGLALGPLLASRLAAGFGWRGGLMVLAGIGLILAPGFAFRRDRPPEPQAAGNGAHDGEARVPAALGLAVACQALLGFCHQGILTFLPFYFGTRAGGPGAGADPLVLGGLITSLTLAVGAAGQYAGGWLSHRAPTEGLFLLLLLGALPFPFLIGAAGATLPPIGAALFSFFFFAAQPVGNLLVARHSREDRRSLAYGVSFTASFGFGALGTPTAGWIVERTGLPSLFPWMGLALSGAALVALGLAFKTRPRQDPAARSPRPPGLST